MRNFQDRIPQQRPGLSAHDAFASELAQKKQVFGAMLLSGDENQVWSAAVRIKEMGDEAKVMKLGASLAGAIPSVSKDYIRAALCEALIVVDELYLHKGQPIVQRAIEDYQKMNAWCHSQGLRNIDRIRDPEEREAANRRNDLGLMNDTAALRRAITHPSSRR